jgi:hypothetical protein
MAIDMAKKYPHYFDGITGEVTIRLAVIVGMRDDSGAFARHAASFIEGFHGVAHDHPLGPGSLRAKRLLQEATQ